MSEKKDNRRINYHYLNKRLTIIGDIPAEILGVVAIALLPFFQGMVMLSIIFILLCGGVIIYAYKKGCKTFQFIVDFLRYQFTDQIKTILPEKKK